MRGSASAAVSLLQLIERLDALLVRNRQQHDVAAFLRAADREDLDARRSRGEGARVAVRRAPNRPARPVRPGMRLRNARGEGTEEEAGRYATQGDRNCGEVVAFAISSTEPGSGLSCAMAWPMQNVRARSENRPMMRTDNLRGVECAV